MFGPIFFIFTKLSEKYGQINPLRPFLEILDPPLLRSAILSIVHLGFHFVHWYLRMDNVLFHKSCYIWYFKHCFCGNRIVPCAICSVVFETMLFATDLSAVMISSRITYFHDLQIEKNCYRKTNTSGGTAYCSVVKHFS